MTEKINLCFVFDDLNLGGSQKLMTDVISLLNRDKYRIKIVVLYECTYNPLYDILKYYDLKYLEIKNFANLFSNIMIVYNEIMYSDYVITASPDSNLYCSVLKKCFPRLGYFICFTHGIDGFYINDEHLNEVKKKFGFLYFIKEKYLLNYFLKYLDIFITVCISLKSYLTEVRNINPEKINTIYLGLITEKYNIKKPEEEYLLVRNRLGINYDDFVIIYSGRLSYAKGLERLIELFNEFRGNNKSKKLIILGNGELRDYLTQQVSNFNLQEYCYFVDFNDNYISYINTSDLFLLPSISESTNLGVQEAMILNKLVLSSDTGGMTELITDTVNGFLFKSGDYDDLLRKLNYIYFNRDKFDEVRFNASKTIYRKFNLRINIQMIENILKNNRKRY